MLVSGCACLIECFIRASSSCKGAHCSRRDAEVNGTLALPASLECGLLHPLSSFL